MYILLQVQKKLRENAMRAFKQNTAQTLITAVAFLVSLMRFN